MTQNLPVDFATRFKAKRLCLGLSQEHLARVLDVSTRRIGAWENGTVPRGLYRKLAVRFVEKD